MYNLRVFACYLVHWLSRVPYVLKLKWGSGGVGVTLWYARIITKTLMSSSKNPKENIRKVFLVIKYFYWIIFRFRPHQNADPSRPRVAAVIDTLISFKNNDLGAWIRGGDIIIKNSGWDISLAMIQFVLVWQFAPSLPVNRGWENKRRMSSQQKNIF